MNIFIDLYNIFFFVLLALALWCAWKISIADWRRRIIPDVYLFPLLLIGLILNVFFSWPATILDATVAATTGYILAWIIGLIFEKLQKDKSTPSPIGLGDVKLIATGGIWLGSMGLAVALVFACLAGIIWGKHKKQKFIPFAPFFITGGILSLITMTFLI